MRDVMYSARKQSKSGKIKTAFITVFAGVPVLFVVGVGVYAWFFFEPPELTITQAEMASSKPAEVSLPWPDDGIAAIGAVGYGVLADDGNADQVVPIASIAKLFLALALQQERPITVGQEGETIVFDQADAERFIATIEENGSSYPIEAGNQLTQREAMQALLIPSANNVADSLTEWGFGSEVAYLEYVAQMNEELGLEQTVIADASGMAAASVSTPRELIMVAEAVLEDPVLAEIVAQPQLTIDQAVGTAFNTNQLLQEQFVTGVKTGTTDEAGANLIFSANYPLTEDISETIIGVTLGQSEREVNTEVSSQLLVSSFENFGFVEVVEENTIVATYNVPWGEDVEIITNGGITVAGWLGRSYEPVVDVDVVDAPIGLTQEVGVLAVEAGNRRSEVPVVTTGTVTEPSFWWRYRATLQGIIPW